MRWKDIEESATAQEAAEAAAKERRQREKIDLARKAKIDAARDYQSDTESANSRINSAAAALKAE